MIDRYIGYIASVRRYSVRTQQIYRDVLEQFASVTGMSDFSTVNPQQGMRIAFRYTNGANAITSWNLDNFVVDLIPNCLSPDKHSVSVYNITNIG